MREIYHSDHLSPPYKIFVFESMNMRLGSSSYLTDNFGRPTHYYDQLPFGESMVEHNQSQYYGNQYKFNGKELDAATGMYYYGARYYDPRISIFISVDPLAEQTFEPYSYVGNNPIMFTDPTGMSKEGGEDYIDIRADGKAVSIKPADGEDKVRIIDNDGNIVSQYTYGENGSFRLENSIERNGLYEAVGYRIKFKDSKKGEKFYKFAAQAKAEFAFMSFCSEMTNTQESYVYTNGSSKNVNGAGEFIRNYLDKNTDALMTYFSHSHPGNFDFNTGYPAYPSGFDENLNPTNIKGDRHTFKDLKYLYKSRIPEYFDIYVPSMPNIKLKFNGNEVKRTF